MLIGVKINGEIKFVKDEWCVFPTPRNFYLSKECFLRNQVIVVPEESVSLFNAS